MTPALSSPVTMSVTGSRRSRNSPSGPESVTHRALPANSGAPSSPGLNVFRTTTAPAPGSSSASTSRGTVVPGCATSQLAYRRPPAWVSVRPVPDMPGTDTQAAVRTRAGAGAAAQPATAQTAAAKRITVASTARAPDRIPITT